MKLSVVGESKIEIVKKAAEKIRKLEVQGATNVAITAVNALSEQLKYSKSLNRESVLLSIDKAKNVLFKSRETEPFMRNAIRFMEWKLRNAVWNSREDLQELVQDVSENLLNDFKVARQKIVEIGSRRILPETRILTHCHSSAVTSVIIRAKQLGIEFEVTCTETRPVFQGRITAKELLEAGIKTTLIVDSAIRSFLTKADLVLVGADAITSEGNVINKIGTSQLALAANEARVPFYVIAELLKFDPQTIHGEYEVIEERDKKEVWVDAPEDLIIRNPAFDVTRRGYIHGIICEEGVISPHSILEIVRRRYPWIIDYSKL